MKVTQIRIEDPLFTVIADSQVDYITVNQSIFMTNNNFDTAVSVKDNHTLGVLKRLVTAMEVATRVAKGEDTRYDLTKIY